MKIIGVTKCPTGIVHTYIAAERLEKYGKELGCVPLIVAQDVDLHMIRKN